MPRFLLAVLIAGFTLAAAAPGGARLVGQRTTGTSRVCIYEAPRAPTGPRVRERNVGLGEPCPPHFRPPPRAAASPIPPSARLEGMQRRRDQTICTYAYQGRQYSRALPASATCPRTAGSGG